MKILLLKPSSLGDVVQALPVLRLLKLHFPQASILWWIDSKLAPLLEGDPDLAGVIIFERHGWAAPRNWQNLWRALHWTREQQFDVVIDLQSLARSGAFAWLANGALTIGLDDGREGARGFYDISVRRPSSSTHAVDWYLKVLEALRVPVHWNFTWLPERPEVATSCRERFGIDGARWLLLQPGARWLNKRWPAGYFAELVRQALATFPDLRFAVLGGAEDAGLGKEISAAGGERCLDLTGKLSLPELIEWIRQGSALVTNDTGPMHIAAALGKPVVSLFGPTNPRRTGPYRQMEGVLQEPLSCVPCMKDFCARTQKLECLTSISPARALAMVARYLNQPSAARVS